MGLQPCDDVVLLLGAPGAGKGTQAHVLAEALGVPHIASGDLLRDHRTRGTDLGREAQAEALEARLAQRGGAVRLAVYVDVPTEVLVDRLSGRWICRGCQSSFHELFNPPRAASVCDGCGGELYQRPDDKREVVANRVAVYLRDTLPVVERYADQGLLRRIDGNQPIETVKLALRQAIGLDEAIPA